MMRVYVAAPLPLLADAKKMATRIEAAGHTVVSTWHLGSPTVAIEAEQSAPRHMETADSCIDDLLGAEALVLLYGPDTTRHGSVFEAGYALGQGCTVVACGLTPDAVLPTILLWAGGVQHCDVDDVLGALS